MNVGTTASIIVEIAGTFNPHVIELVKTVYGEHRQYEPWLRDMQPLAQVGIVRSHDSLEFRPGARNDPSGQAAPHGEDFRGWCQALIAAHQLWDVVPSHLLDAKHLERFQVLLLPSVSCMSPAECAAVRAFVRRGGVLIADAETSLFDSDGHQQQDFQLADVFGASLAAQCSADRSHLHVEDQAFQASQPWGESTLPMTEGQWGVKAAAGARVLGTVRANPGLSLVSVLVATGEPAFLLSPCGTGRCYYFAGAIGRQYRRYGQANVFQLMRKVLAAAAGKAAPVALDAPASVELFAHTQPGKEHLVVNLVNVFGGLSRSDGRALSQAGKAEVEGDIRHDEYEESPRLSQVVLRFRTWRGKPLRRTLLAPDSQELPCRTEGSETLVTVKDLAEHAMIVAEY